MLGEMLWSRHNVFAATMVSPRFMSESLDITQIIHQNTKATAFTLKEYLGAQLDFPSMGGT